MAPSYQVREKLGIMEGIKKARPWQANEFSSAGATPALLLRKPQPAARISLDAPPAAGM